MTGCSATRLQTLLVGLDAGCLNVLEPMFDDGALPNLESLFEAGAAGPLESQIPPWTPSAWPSIYTGVNPGKHGVFGFLQFDGYDWNVVDSTSVHEPTLWELLDEHGYRSVVVNAPVTYPAPEIDGAVVPGYVAPSKPDGHPEGIVDDVEAEIGAYRLYNDPEEPDDDASNLEDFLELTRMRGEAFRYLYDRFEPEFGFVQFQQTDTVFHEYPGNLAYAREVYEAVDEQIGAILEDCDPSNVVVVSDHGIDAYDRRFRVNDHLQNHGYVESVRGGNGMPAWSAIREGKELGRQGLVERFLEVAARFGFTSQRAASVLKRLRLADVFEDLVPDSAIRAASEQVDFANSTAYMRSRVECGVRINLAGREPEGVVPEERYEAVRDELMDLLARARTPEGDPVFEDVAPREEYFHGPHVESAVDVVTVPNDFRYYLTTWLVQEDFETPDEPAWDHRMEGVVAVHGDALQGGAIPADAQLFDVAPTVLATMGVPASDRMDGTALDVVADAGTVAYDSTGGADRDAGGDSPGADVESRLADLGYLEGA